jgi:hypothetical protein
MGKAFGTDPVEILRCSEEEWLIRHACAKVIEADNEEQNAAT